jgi:hypothetical protein
MSSKPGIKVFCLVIPIVPPVTKNGYDAVTDIIYGKPITFDREMKKR